MSLTSAATADAILRQNKSRLQKGRILPPIKFSSLISQNQNHEIFKLGQNILQKYMKVIASYLKILL